MAARRGPFHLRSVLLRLAAFLIILDAIATKNFSST
jgi:hypothetical protein